MAKAKISDLKFDERNANRGTARGRGAIEESLQKYGAGRSVLLDRNNRLIAGNKTTEVAAESGFENVIIVETDGTQLVAVKRTDLDLETDDRAKMLALLDNRSSELSLDWNPEVLAELNQELDLSGLWSDDELSKILSELDQGEPEPPKEENESGVGDLLDRAESGTIELRVKPGELWQLGRHRLICGDSTDQATISRLMGGQVAQCVISDPPYNVAYNPEQRRSHFSAERTANPLGTIANDKMDDDSFRAFLDAVYDRFNENLEPGCPIYIFHADTMGHHFRNAFVAQPWKLQSCLIWKKTVLVFGRADYHWMHEPVLYGWKEGASHRYYGDRKQTTIVEFAAPHYDKGNCDTDGYVHSCQKSTPMLRYFLENSTQPGDIVLDLFAGSGSTLISAEQSGRVCYTSELDPRFASVVWERYFALTGETPVLIESVQN